MKKVLIPLFLFLIVLTPAYAYLPIDKNVSYTGGLATPVGMACTNVTGTFYCYTYGNNAANQHVYIERWNATLGDRKYCDIGAVGYYAFTRVAGIEIANETHVMLPWLSGDGSGLYGFRLVPISDMTSSTTCTSTDTINTKFNSTWPSVTVTHCGYYSNPNSSFMYCGHDNGMRNSTTNVYVSAPFWDTNVETLHVPNQSDNGTVYGLYDNLFFKYVGGAFVSNPGSIDTAWGIPKNLGISGGQYNWDLFKESAANTWLYVHSGTRLYRVNFTEFENVSGGSSMVAVHPTGNETLADTTPELHGIVYSVLNGTVGWYVDGLFKENNTITTDGVSVDAYFTTDTLATGNHYWSATFYDSAGYTWSTGSQYFIVNTAYEGSDYTGDDQVEALGDYLDTAFSSPFGGEIFALIMSGLIAGVIWYYSGHSKIEFLIAPLMFILACFSFIGMFPMWFMVLEVITVAVFIFFKVR